MGPGGGNQRVFADDNFRMIDESVLLELADEIAHEIADADETIPLNGARQVHAMERDDTAGHHHASQFRDQEIEAGEELAFCPYVAHVLQSVGVGIKRTERQI